MNMHDRFTAGDWIVARTGGLQDRVMVTAPPNGAIAVLDSTYKSEDEVQANAHLVAAAPRLARALAIMVLTPGIRAHLETQDPKALEQAMAALGAAKVFEPRPIITTRGG